MIGGGPAAGVVFPREVRARAERDPRVIEARRAAAERPSAEARAELDRLLDAVGAEKRAELAAEFDAIHTVERARAVGSLEEIVPAAGLRGYLIELLEEAARHALPSVADRGSGCRPYLDSLS